eukprot:SAG31_NODE_42901_length_269_cov_0.917647_1_plen_81_part_01
MIDSVCDKAWAFVFARVVALCFARHHEQMQWTTLLYSIKSVELASIERSLRALPGGAYTIHERSGQRLRAGLMAYKFRAEI